MSGALIRPRPRPRASRTLLCLSFCGGGTAPFRSWADALPDDVELALYCYPGREARFTVPFARDWEELLGDAVAAVRTVAARPYVLFGHSMGAWVAFDLARRVEGAGAFAPPLALVASAAEAPSRVRAGAHTTPCVHDTDAALLDWMGTSGQLPEAVRAEPEMMQIALELFRADLRVVDTYRFAPHDRVRTPVQVLYGEDDDVDAGAVERWRALTDGGLTADALPGGHFYTPGAWARLPGRLAALRPARLG
ncbi:thioesterase II family protein [Streptomyces sp. NPDC050504]|uniref:thioesterase II family protein n=1 Tax=Streptomyces sp. NPDC050504 TaxID=3365618 RepID=UPI0037980824